MNESITDAPKLFAVPKTSLTGTGPPLLDPASGGPPSAVPLLDPELELVLEPLPLLLVDEPLLLLVLEPLPLLDEPLLLLVLEPLPLLDEPLLLLVDEPLLLEDPEEEPLPLEVEASPSSKGPVLLVPHWTVATNEPTKSDTGTPQVTRERKFIV